MKKPFPKHLFNQFVLLVLPFCREKELKLTMFLCSYLALTNSSNGFLDKGTLVDGFYDINDFGVMNIETNGSGILEDDLDNVLMQLKNRNFIQFKEVESHFIKFNINTNFINEESKKYLPIYNGN
jgi:hypothetical protein